MACSLWYVRFLETNSWYVPNYMFWDTWNSIYQCFIFSYSKPFINFAAISEVLML